MSRSYTGVTDPTENLACPVSEVIERVAGKWAVGILVAAAEGPIRFTELERGISGISRRMLTLNLRKLEREGLLVRTVYPTVPPKVEYECTEMAFELYETLMTLVGWAKKHGSDIARAHAAYDAAHSPESGPDDESSHRPRPVSARSDSISATR
jgi:DNA-binding HxlR family transcriptional regulator